MSVLADKFIVPPFSVIDRRSGVWADNRRRWEERGLFNADGRPKGITYGSPMMADPRYLEKYDRCCEELGRRISKKEFNEEYYDGDLEGYTSRFDPLLAELVYRWFCQPQGLVLDPFAGGAARGCVAGVLGYGYYGIDLYEEQVKANRTKAVELAEAKELVSIPRWTVGDSRTKLDDIEPENVDLVFSCPPYYNVEVYGEDSRELAHCENWEVFKKDYCSIIAKSVKALKNNRFAVFEVGDVRLPDGHYAGIPSATIEAFEQAGAGLYNTIIVLDPCGTAGLRANRQFSSSRKVVRTHQELLVFFKGDPRLIVASPVSNYLLEPALSTEEAWGSLL